MKNVENGITDRFKHLPERSSVIMSQINKNFHEHWTKIQDRLNFHITPEALILSKFARDLQISMLRNNVLTQKKPFQQKPGLITKLQILPRTGRNATP